MGNLESEFKGINVDLDHFETFVKYAHVLSVYVRDDLLRVTLADGKWSPLETQDGNPFGKLDEAERLQRNVVGARTALTQRVQDLSGRLEHLHQALQEIADDYKSVDALNNADAKKIEALLESPARPAQPKP